jgi:predicted RNase H-like HicB family nuclease
MRPPLDDYLAQRYPFQVIADPDGGYVIVFPDLPGCLTQVERLEEVPAAAEEARTLWIETAYAQGLEIPPPSYPEAYSGKFVVRLPKALHRRLAEEAARQGVSLNQYVVALLAQGDALARLDQRLARLEENVTAIRRQLEYHFPTVPGASERRSGHLRLIYKRAVAV